MNLINIKKHLRAHPFLWGGGCLAGVVACLCLGFFGLAEIAGRDPGVQATGTARAVARITETSQALSLVQLTPSPTLAASATKVPVFTATQTLIPTKEASPLPSPSNTRVPESTVAPTATNIPTLTNTPTITNTPFPSTAGISDWAVYNDGYLGVQEIAFDKFLGYYSPESGKIFVSLYVVAFNMSASEVAFSDFDFSLVDGGGEVTSGALLASKEPSFSTCTILPGGKCEGWWTTIIWDRPEVKQNLVFRWDPCLIFCEVDFYALPISQ